MKLVFKSEMIHAKAFKYTYIYVYSLYKSMQTITLVLSSRLAFASKLQLKNSIRIRHKNNHKTPLSFF